MQCQAIILAPTRDLAQQIFDVVTSIGDFLGLKILACVGGTNERLDIKALNEGVHIVIGERNQTNMILIKAKQTLKDRY